MSLIGPLRVAGSTPLQVVLIQPEDSAGVEFELVGDLKIELESLSGARVQVSGTVTEGERLVVSDYKILEIAGHVPVVGVLNARGAAVDLMTDAGETVSVEHSPELEALDGAKVWIILDSKGTVTGYGVIRKR